MILHHTKEELEEILCFQKKDNIIFMPNRIFTDLLKTINTELPKRSCEHIAFAYSYVYLTSYLYRYAIYGITDTLFTKEMLYKLLLTPPNNKTKNYITKKQGILDQLNYIKKQSDFPVIYDDSDKHHPAFTMHSELKNHYPSAIVKKYPANYRIDFPYRAFYDDDGMKNNGYFFNVENTHLVALDTFIFCMSKSDLGTIGFYLYCYLKHKNDLFPTGFCKSKIALIGLTGIKESKLKDTLKALESYNMITNSHEPFYTNINKASESVKLKPCTYQVIHPNKFSEEKREIIVREIIDLSEQDELEAN